MLVVGVDPGVSGAFALLDTGNRTLDVFEMPRLTVRVGKTDRPRVDLDATFALGAALGAFNPDFAVHEKVQGFGGQNAAAAFVFGGAACAAEMGIIAGRIPRRYVQPDTWKKRLGISSEKENAVLEANRLFPDYTSLFASIRGVRTKEQGIGNAEAALIAYYGATHLCSSLSSA